MIKGIPTDKVHKEFTYRITVDKNPVSGGDFIFDFAFCNWGRDPIIQCDSDYFAELINKEHQKPFYERRSAKIIASNDPVLNLYGVPGL